MKNLNLKIVGLVDNALMKTSDNKDKIFAVLDERLIDKNDVYYTVYVNYKSGYEKIDSETNKLISALGLNKDTLYYNKDVLQTNTLMKNINLDNPRFRNLVFSGVLFSLVTMIIYSKKRIEDMKLLRVNGASKKQILSFLINEGIFISILSLFFGNALGIFLAKIFVNNINYTLATQDLYNILPKLIHYNPFFTLYTLRIVVIPMFFVLIYQVYSVNKGYAKNRAGIFENIWKKIIGFSFNRSKNVFKKVSTVNFRKNIFYFCIPMVLLALPISNHIYVSNAIDRKNESNINTPGTGLETTFALRSNLIDKDDYYIPEYEFTNSDIEKLRKIKGVRNVLPMIETSAYYISNGNDLSDEYAKNVNPGEEFVFEITSFDKNYIENKGVILDQDKKIKGKYPRIFLKNEVYSREDKKNKGVFKDVKIGDLINLKVPFKDGKNISYKNIEAQIVGFLDSNRLATYISTRGLVGGIYMEPNEFSKIVGYDRVKTIFFDYSGPKDDVKRAINKVIDGGFNFKSIEDVRNEGNNTDILYLEMFINIVYSCVISIFTIFSSIKIMRTLRKREDIIMVSIGVTKKSIRRMYLYEGFKYGIFSTLITVAISIYHIMDEYVFLKTVYDNFKIYINIQRIILTSIIPLAIFTICYLIATRDIKNSVQDYANSI